VDNHWQNRARRVLFIVGGGAFPSYLHCKKRKRIIREE
jgi:hypothetical protein